jgi:hypothetical protein
MFGLNRHVHDVGAATLMHTGTSQKTSGSLCGWRYTYMLCIHVSDSLASCSMQLSVTAAHQLE